MGGYQSLAKRPSRVALEKFIVCTVLSLFLVMIRAAAAEPEPDISQPPVSLWKTKPGEGFVKGTRELDFSVGGGVGLPVLTSVGRHDWVMSMADYGWVFTDVVESDHWYRGNWELIGNFFAGYQFSPEGAYVVGIGPHLRYDFAAGHRWVPFIDAGAGVSATDIREPDLSTTFEFNLQAGAGTHYFLNDKLAITVQGRFIHLSNAGIKYTNLGVNNATFLIGISRFF